MEIMPQDRSGMKTFKQPFSPVHSRQMSCNQNELNKKRCSQNKQRQWTTPTPRKQPIFTTLNNEPVR